MTRNVLAGALLAVVATGAVLLSGILGPEVQGVALLGAALGGALGIAPDRTPGQRIAAFAAGFTAAWIGYLLRAAALPDAAAGRAVAVFIVLMICLAVSAGTRGRLPLWAALLGAAAMAGAYETAYTADPSAFATTSPIAATAVLLTAGAGVLATALLSPSVAHDRAREDQEALPPEPEHNRPTHVAEPTSYRPFEPAPEA
ncbi:hypothetical protein QUV83_07470 [Cellulomonas cellasea]|uniref:hypothetical protein n=1 Tax=Cellulomonas cellasea TaxID=43670 RepID=UPI0025A318C0|nr:hypothetical protein [Cellulomonas cellasea]MDM8084596.1 hypothetical protein [Cellulomonas cellasea]